MNQNPKKTSTAVDGELGTYPSPGTIQIERILPGPIERVWKYLTDSEMRGRWLCSGEMELREGGRFEMIFRNSDLTHGDDRPPAKYAGDEKETHMKGRITQCNPPNLLSFEWFEPTGEATEVTFELSPRGEEVHLLLTHRDLRKRDEMIGVSAGWHTHLGILVDQLRDRKSPPFWATLVALEDEYDKRITDKDVPAA